MPRAIGLLADETRGKHNVLSLCSDGNGGNQSLLVERSRGVRYLDGRNCRIRSAANSENRPIIDASSRAITRLSNESVAEDVGHSTS